MPPARPMCCISPKPCAALKPTGIKVRSFAPARCALRAGGSQARRQQPLLSPEVALYTVRIGRRPGADPFRFAATAGWHSPTCCAVAALAQACGLHPPPLLPGRNGIAHWASGAWLSTLGQDTHLGASAVDDLFIKIINREIGEDHLRGRPGSGLPRHRAPGAVRLVIPANPYAQ